MHIGKLILEWLESHHKANWIVYSKDDPHVPVKAVYDRLPDGTPRVHVAEYWFPD